MNFRNGVLTLKTHQIISLHATPEKSESTTITGFLNLLLRKTGAGKSHDDVIDDDVIDDDVIDDDVIDIKKLGLKMFSVDNKTQSKRFQISPM